MQILLSMRNRHLLLLDIVLLPVAVIAAFGLRLNSLQFPVYVQIMLVYALAAPLIQIPIFAALGLYSRFWRYASTDEALLLMAAASLGGLVQGAVFIIAQVIVPDAISPGVPRSIPLIAILVTLFTIAAPRMSLRLWWRESQRAAKSMVVPRKQQRVLIAGAGQAGAMVLRELRDNPQTGLISVGFVDDDPGTHGMRIHHELVLGATREIPYLVQKHGVDQVIIAMPTAPGSVVRQIMTLCQRSGVPARIVPGMYELLSGKVTAGQLRDVQIEDLLRREPIHIDSEQVRAMLCGRRVLVTGGGGSIGSELCRQIIGSQPSELILLGHGENSIFDVSNELATINQGISVESVIADLRDRDRLAAVFHRYQPEIVFHAAAHKHVPLMEVNAEEAITNNVLGTRLLVETSLTSGVTHFVLISTDKAINPTSTMGASKRVAELIVQQAGRRSGRCYVAVRFGNVLGSRGSVVPFFQKQIAQGGPVTVTHPEMRRYFMTIPEAVQLVLQAAVLGSGGEVFALDMGAPVKIVDLATDLIRLSGLEPGRDIEITFTGMRPGEKLFEEVFANEDDFAQTTHAKILVCRNGSDPSQVRPDLDAAIDRLVAAARQGEPDTVRRLLQEIVPTYTPTAPATRLAPGAAINQDARVASGVGLTGKH